MVRNHHKQTVAVMDVVETKVGSMCSWTWAPLALAGWRADMLTCLGPTGATCMLRGVCHDPPPGPRSLEQTAQPPRVSRFVSLHATDSARKQLRIAQLALWVTKGSLAIVNAQLGARMRAMYQVAAVPPLQTAATPSSSVLPRLRPPVVHHWRWRIQITHFFGFNSPLYHGNPDRLSLTCI